MKKILPDIIAIIAFIILSFTYFFPAVIEDRNIYQQDAIAGVGSGQEVKEYYTQTGIESRWTNALFGGMPTYQISPSYASNKPLKCVQDIYHLYLPSNVWLVFVMMLGFYILLRACGQKPLMSAFGGLIWGLSSYFLILIGAGHIWKFVTLAYIPPTIAGIVLTYRKKYLLGGIVTALFLALQIQANHVQMSYYFGFAILLIICAYFEMSWKKKELPHFFKATGVLIIAAIIGIGINFSNLYQTYEYSKQTMRGMNELTQNPSAKQQAKSGLDRDYITQWSYGIGETMTLLVPNIRGGASIPLSENETAMKKADSNFGNLYAQIGQYFGDQPGTSGPVYVGAFVLFLFILGCFIVKGPMKWALLGATLLSVFLSWGKNFMPMTDFFIDYVPMYNKFRAVSSILVVAEFTIPLLAVFALKAVLDEPKILKEKRPFFIVSLILTAGVAFLTYVMPDMFVPSYIPAAEMNALHNGIPSEQVSAVIANLSDMRRSLVTSDALHSLIIILIGVAMLLLYSKKKLNAQWTTAAIAVLCLIDLWGVDKRYLNDKMFTTASTKDEAYVETDADRMILQDKTPDYRVLNLSTNTFNENITSFRHKSIGGYHPAKLRRYQDMIDHHITGEMQTAYKEIATANGRMDSVDAKKFPVLNMLNTRYFILPLQQGKTIAIQNPYAYGNAWFVDKILLVDNADQEIQAVGVNDPRTIAIVDKRFKEMVGNVADSAKQDTASTIKLTRYTPNKLTYEANSTRGGLAVFSEIYYPEWEAFVDGKPVQIARADYILRAINIPAGKHTVEMRFDPKSIHVTEAISYTCSGILLLCTAAGVGFWWMKRKKEVNK